MAMYAAHWHTSCSVEPAILFKIVMGAGMMIETFHEFTPQDFIFKIARSQDELGGYWDLRRAVFCREQGIFADTDRDEFDDSAIPIICESLIGGMEDSVVGAVRIDERESGIWYG